MYNHKQEVPPIVKGVEHRTQVTGLYCGPLLAQPALWVTERSGNFVNGRIMGHSINTHIVSTDAQLDVTAELALESLLILLLQGAHIVSHVLAEDVGTVNIGVEVLGLGRVAGETLHGVRDVQTTIDSTLHGAEDAGTGGGAGQTNIQVATEGTWSIIDGLNVELLTGDLGAAGVQRVQTQLVQQATGNKQTSAVGSSIVGQTHLSIILIFIRLVIHLWVIYPDLP